MTKTIVLAPALALALAFPARAMTDAKPTNQVTRGHGLNAEVVEVQTRPSPVGVIARDAIGGAVASPAVGGGGGVYRYHVTKNSNADWGNWHNDIPIGAAISP